MMNFAARDAAARVGAIKAIALGQKMFERPSLRLKDPSCWAVFAFQNDGVGTAMGSLAGVLDPSIALFAFHARAKIRQMKPGTSDGDGNRIARVEAEEPDAGSVIGDHVGAHIQLGKC